MKPWCPSQTDQKDSTFYRSLIVKIVWNILQTSLVNEARALRFKIKLTSVYCSMSRQRKKVVYWARHEQNESIRSIYTLAAISVIPLRSISTVARRIATILPLRKTYQRLSVVQKQRWVALRGQLQRQLRGNERKCLVPKYGGKIQTNWRWRVEIQETLQIIFCVTEYITMLMSHCLCDLSWSVTLAQTWPLLVPWEIPLQHDMIFLLLI